MATRRSLLKKTLGGAALLAAAGAVPVALRKTKVRELAAGRKLRFFTPAEYSIWAAAADRILAREPTAATGEDPPMPPAGAAPAPADVDVAGKADAFLAELGEEDRRELKQLLALFENALFSVVTGGPPRPFTRMDATEQDAHLRAWQTSRIAVRRTGYQVLKRLTCALYFASPETHASVGYPGPPVDLVRSVLDARKGASR